MEIGRMGSHLPCSQTIGPAVHFSKVLVFIMLAMADAHIPKPQLALDEVVIYSVDVGLLAGL